MANVLIPTGPPENFSHNEIRIALEALSKPRSSTPKNVRPSRATSPSIYPSRST